MRQRTRPVRSGREFLDQEGAHEVGHRVPVGHPVERLAGQAAQVRRYGGQVEPVVNLAACPQPAHEHQDRRPDERRDAVVYQLRVPRVGEPGETLMESGEKDAASCGQTRARGRGRLA